MGAEKSVETLSEMEAAQTAQDDSPRLSAIALIAWRIPALVWLGMLIAQSF
jgi:hypothetical protein